MVYRDPTAPRAARVADLLSRMTLAEKAAQLTQTHVHPGNRTEVEARIRAHGLGSRILADAQLTGNLTQHIAAAEDLNALQRVAVEESRLGIPLLHGRDIIHGHRTVFPIPLAQAAAFDPALVEEACAIAAREAASAGVHWTFAPMLDIARDPRWGRIIEGFGEDPFLTARLAEAAVWGFQSRAASAGAPYPPDRVAACAKHYLGYGAAVGGRDYNTAEISEHTLRNIYLPPFQAAVRAGVATVMSAFHDLNGESASGSYALLTELLRGALGFQGLVVSDWESVAELVIHRLAADRREAAALAFNAGVDMDMVAGCFEAHLPELTQSGQVSLARLEEAVGRVLALKFQLGLFERPYLATGLGAEVQFTPAHQAAARRAAARSLVLLKNDGRLPLPGDFAGRLAVIGPLAAERRALLGSWVNDGVPAETPTLAEAARAAWPAADLHVAAGPLADEMLAAARQAEVVLMAVGESNTRSGEANCTTTLDLPAGQEALLEAVHQLGKPILLVVFAGRPVALTRCLPLAAAVLYAWHPGSQGAAAVCDVLTGAVNPSGRLPVSLPRSVGQVPLFYNHASTGRPWFQYLDAPVQPLFAFGFGLSYTAFTYTDARVEAVTAAPTVTVSAQVANTGARPGEAVVQCYVQDEVASLTRPVRELKGFQRVALAPGEAQRVTFTLGAAELGFYGRGGGWRVEPGAFTVWIGGDSQADLAVRVIVPPPG